MNLDTILYAPEADPTKVKRELEKLFPTVDILYRLPHEPLFQFQMQCLNEAGDTCRVIRYGWSNVLAKWFFEDLTEESVTCQL